MTLLNDVVVVEAIPLLWKIIIVCITIIGSLISILMAVLAFYGKDALKSIKSLTNALYEFGIMMEKNKGEMNLLQGECVLKHKTIEKKQEEHDKIIEEHEVQLTEHEKKIIIITTKLNMNNETVSNHT